MPDYGPIETFLVGRCGKTEREAGLTSYHEYQMLVKGREDEWKERMEVARWICYHIYAQNPYIKPPRAMSQQAYCRFPWEEVTKEEAEEAARRCIVTDEEAEKLNQIFESLNNREK